MCIIVCPGLSGIVVVDQFGLQPGSIIFKLIIVIVTVGHFQKQTTGVSSVCGVSVPWIVLELCHDIDTGLLWHGIGNHPVHAVIGFCLGRLVGANNPGEIDAVIVMKFGGPP